MKMHLALLSLASLAAALSLEVDDSILSLVQHRVSLHDAGELSRSLRSTILIRMRQAALLRAADAPGAESQPDLAPKVPDPNLVSARNALLTESGYHQVANLGSAAEMKIFIQRTLANMKLHVLDEDMLNGLVRFYDGECMKQSYKNLQAELLNATAPFKCHAPWVEPDDGRRMDSDEDVAKRPLYGWNMHLDEELPVVATQNEYVTAATGGDESMKMFIARVVSRMGGTILNEEKLSKLAQAFVNQTGKDSFEGILHDVSIIGNSSRDENSWIKLGGEFAPLNEDGYKAIATRHVRGEMTKFVRRVIQDQGLVIVQEGGLHGMLAYYNGMCAVQSYDNLVRELHNAAYVVAPDCGGGWVQPVESSSN